VVFGFEVPKRECHLNLRNFKSTTLDEGFRSAHGIVLAAHALMLIGADEITTIESGGALSFVACPRE